MERRVELRDEQRNEHRDEHKANAETYRLPSSPGSRHTSSKSASAVRALPGGGGWWARHTAQNRFSQPLLPTSPPSGSVESFADTDFEADDAACAAVGAGACSQSGTNPRCCGCGAVAVADNGKGVANATPTPAPPDGIWSVAGALVRSGPPHMVHDETPGGLRNVHAPHADAAGGAAVCDPAGAVAGGDAAVKVGLPVNHDVGTSFGRSI
jgi:hypothetical protein